MKKLEKLKKERAELDKRIESLEYAERLFEEGDEIWSIDHFGNVQRGNWGDYEWVYSAFVQGNIFKTKQESEMEAKRRNLLTRFRAFRDECNDGWKPDFTIHDNKYFIEKRSGKTDVNYICTVNAFILFGYFKNYEDAQRAIELFGDEIQKLFIDCECD